MSVLPEAGRIEYYIDVQSLNREGGNMKRNDSLKQGTAGADVCWNHFPRDLASLANNKILSFSSYFVENCQ